MSARDPKRRERGRCARSRRSPGTRPSHQCPRQAARSGRIEPSGGYRPRPALHRVRWHARRPGGPPGLRQALSAEATGQQAFRAGSGTGRAGRAKPCPARCHPVSPGAQGSSPLGAAARRSARPARTASDLAATHAALELAMARRARAVSGTDDQRCVLDHHRQGGRLPVLPCEAGIPVLRLTSTELRRDHRRPRCPHEHLLTIGHAVHPPPAGQVTTTSTGRLSGEHARSRSSDCHADPRKRVFLGAFTRNARALVELHRGRARRGRWRW